MRLVVPAALLAMAALALLPASHAASQPIGAPAAPPPSLPALPDAPSLPHGVPDPAPGVIPSVGPQPLPGTGDSDPGHAPGIGDPIGNGGFGVWTWAGFAGFGAALSAGAGFLLVTRYVSPKEALKNPQRAMLYGFVRGNPGVHLKKLSDEFAMKTSSILWHIRKLESAELVRSERANGFRVFYPVEGGIEMKRVSRGITALQNVNARRLLEFVERHPGKDPAALALELKIHVGTVRWHLRKLRDFGLVEELVRDDESLSFATPLGRRTLTTLLGTPTTPATLTSATAAAALANHPLLQNVATPVDDA